MGVQALCARPLQSPVTVSVAIGHHAGEGGHPSSGLEPLPGPKAPPGTQSQGPARLKLGL